jgi:chloramphenicol 3-O-phosphotransferase
VNKGKIILLNGTSSSGKSTLAEALQSVLDEPYLHIDGDFFWQSFQVLILINAQMRNIGRGAAVLFQLAIMRLQPCLLRE